MYSQDIRERMSNELANCGSSMVINWNSTDYGAFTNFRMTVRYVADTLGMKVATRRDGNRLIVTRSDPPTIAHTKSGFIFCKSDLVIAMETIDMLRPMPNDPNREYKHILIDFLSKVCDQGVAYIDEQIARGDRDPE